VEHNHGLPLAAPNHIADAHVQQENQEEGNQPQVALNVEHNHGLPFFIFFIFFNSIYTRKHVWLWSYRYATASYCLRINMYVIV